MVTSAIKTLPNPKVFRQKFTASTNLTGRQNITRIDLAAFHSTIRYHA